MRGTSYTLIAGLAGLAASTTSGSASRAVPSEEARQVGSVRFTETRPGRPTRVVLKVDYRNPGDPDAKPPPVRTTELVFARGTSIDTSVPDRCTADDAELKARGAAACPEGSRIGSGRITADTGIVGPNRRLRSDVTLLNEKDQLIFLSTIRGTSVRLVTRSPIRGRRVTNTVPDLPGTPPDGGALDAQRLVRNRIPAARGSRRGYMTTPPTCPRRGYWVNRTTFTYEDGVEQVARTRSPCRRPQGRGRGRR